MFINVSLYGQTPKNLGVARDSGLRGKAKVDFAKENICKYPKVNVKVSLYGQTPKNLGVARDSGLRGKAKVDFAKENICKYPKYI